MTGLSCALYNVAISYTIDNIMPSTLWQQPWNFRCKGNRWLAEFISRVDQPLWSTSMVFRRSVSRLPRTLNTRNMSFDAITTMQSLSRDFTSAVIGLLWLFEWSFEWTLITIVGTISGPWPHDIRSSVSWLIASDVSLVKLLTASVTTSANRHDWQTTAWFIMLRGALIHFVMPTVTTTSPEMPSRWMT